VELDGFIWGVINFWSVGDLSVDVREGKDSLSMHYGMRTIFRAMGSSTQCDVTAIPTSDAQKKKCLGAAPTPLSLPLRCALYNMEANT
jgi:hypothetical protein